MALATTAAFSTSLTPLPRLILVTGPTRSGKSEWAENLAMQSGQPVIYVATAQIDPDDSDWQARIDRHRQRRPETWGVWEVPVELPVALETAMAGDCLLVDSLGTWLANQIDLDDAAWDLACQELVTSLQQTPSTVILVAEETGWGVVPTHASGRLFRDRLGTLTRQVGGIVDRVYLVVAGYAVDLRSLGQAVPWSVSITDDLKSTLS